MQKSVSRPLTLLAVAGLFAATGCSSGGTAPTATTRTTAANSPSPTAAPASIEIAFEENAQVELKLAGGRVVFIDVWNPASLVNQPTAQDVLLTTHGHPDHISPDWQAAFPGQQLYIKAGQIKLDDVTVTGIPAAHNEGDALEQENGTDYLFLVEAAGLRIGHFGDLGQEKLTDDQLKTLGRLDIVFSQLSNSFSAMDDANHKGLNQMQQVKPLVFVPTHLSAETVKQAAAVWKAAYAPNPTIKLSTATLPKETTMVFMGNQAITFKNILGLQPATW